MLPWKKSLSAECNREQILAAGEILHSAVLWRAKLWAKGQPWTVTIDDLVDGNDVVFHDVLVDASFANREFVNYEGFCCDTNGNVAYGDYVSACGVGHQTRRVGVLISCKDDDGCDEGVLRAKFFQQVSFDEHEVMCRAKQIELEDFKQDVVTWQMRRDQIRNLLNVLVLAANVGGFPKGGSQ